jgi:glycine cleavage system H protein
MTKERKEGPSGEWVECDGRVATIGFTEAMCAHIGDIVWVDLPEEGRSVQQGDVIVVIESGKAAHDFVSPLSGKITAVNQEITKKPELLLFPQGWVVQLGDIDQEEWRHLSSSNHTS